MKIVYLFITLNLICLNLFAQKSFKNDYFSFMIPPNVELEQDLPIKFYAIDEEEFENQFVFELSQSNSLKYFISDYFIYKDSSFSEIKTPYCVFKKYDGYFNEINNPNIPAELYVYQKENVCLAIVRYTNRINNADFEIFINSISIKESIYKWYRQDFNFLSLMLPKMTKPIGDLFDGYEMNTIFSEGDEFYCNISFLGHIPPQIAINSNNNLFIEKLGTYIKISLEHNDGVDFSQDFMKRLKASIQIKNYAPPGQILDLKTATEIYGDDEVCPTDWFYVFNKNYIVRWNAVLNSLGYKYKKITSEPSSVFVWDNEYLLVGTNEGELLIYFITSDKSYAKIKAHEKKINQIDYIYKLGMVTCSDDKTVKIWDFSGDFETLKKTLNAHTDAVTCFTFNEKYLITGSDDNTIIVWDYSGNIINKLTEHKDDITDLKIIERQLLVSASKDETIKLWDITTGELLKSVKLTNAYVKCFDHEQSNFSAQSQFITGLSSGEVIIWNSDGMTKDTSYSVSSSVDHVKFYFHGILALSNNKLEYTHLNKK